MALPAPLLQLKTYADLLAMPDDGNRYELIHGEIVMSPSPVPKHQRVLAALNERMRAYAYEHRLGDVLFSPVDVRFAIDSAVQPDLVFIRRERLGIVGVTAVDGVPDLVVEVLSPSNRAYDLVKKASLYQRFGVPEYWVVDPESEQIVVNVLRDGRYAAALSDDRVARSGVLPAFEVRPEDVFALPAWMTEAATDTGS